MNDELKTRLVKYLDALEAASRKGADFVAEQAPETVKQYLTWGIVESVFYAIVCWIVCAGCIWGIKSLTKLIKSHTDDEFVCGFGFTGTVLCGVACLISACISVGQILTALKIWVAPNVYLIEWAASLVKKAN